MKKKGYKMNIEMRPAMITLMTFDFTLYSQYKQIYYWKGFCYHLRGNIWERIWRKNRYFSGEEVIRLEAESISLWTEVGK